MVATTVAQSEVDGQGKGIELIVTNQNELDITAPGTAK